MFQNGGERLQVQSRKKLPISMTDYREYRSAKKHAEIQSTHERSQPCDVYDFGEARNLVPAILHLSHFVLYEVTIALRPIDGVVISYRTKHFFQ